MDSKSKQQEFECKLKDLSRKAASTIKKKSRHIVELRDTLVQNCTDDLISELTFISHGLAGTAGTYNFHSVSYAAKDLELMLVNWKEKQPSQHDVDILLPCLDYLIEQCNQVVSSEDEEIAAELGQCQPLGTKAIFIIDDDEEIGDYLSTRLQGYGYVTRYFCSIAEAKKAIKEDDPGALIVDMSFPEGELAGAQLLTDIRKESVLEIPTIFISTNDSFESRVKAVRAGSDAFFVKPIDIIELADSLDVLVAKNRLDPFKVVIIDDDMDVLKYYDEILTRAGIETFCSDDPTLILELLIMHRPDVLLLDLYMPEHNGLQLAGVVRQHKSFSHLPILALSSEQNTQIHFQMRHRGIDEVLSKPIAPGNLVNIIANRAQKSRSIAAELTQESMTKTLNKVAFMNELGRQIDFSERTCSNFTLVVLDIDHFKAVNDTYGHLVGDMVIKRLVEYLKSNLRKVDLIGRIGGEEFAIVLPMTDAKNAYRVLDAIREDCSQISHMFENETFKVSFSAGLCELSKNQSTHELMKLADTSLYLAKKAGRNQIK